MSTHINVIVIQNQSKAKLLIKSTTSLNLGLAYLLTPV